MGVAHQELAVGLGFQTERTASRVRDNGGGSRHRVNSDDRAAFDTTVEVAVGAYDHVLGTTTRKRDERCRRELSRRLGQGRGGGNDPLHGVKRRLHLRLDLGKHDAAVLSVRVGRGDDVGVYRGAGLRDGLGQGSDLGSAKRCLQGAVVGGTDDKRAVELLVVGVVVRDTRGVPRRGLVRREGVGANLRDARKRCQRGTQILVEERREGRLLTAWSLAQQHHCASPGHRRSQAGEPSPSVQGGRVQDRPTEHVGLVLMHQLVRFERLESTDRAVESHFRSAVDAALVWNLCLDTVNGWPQAGCGRVEVVLPVLAEPGAPGHQLAVRTTPVLHAVLAGPVRPHPQQHDACCHPLGLDIVGCFRASSTRCGGVHRTAPAAVGPASVEGLVSVAALRLPRSTAQ